MEEGGVLAEIATKITVEVFLFKRKAIKIEAFDEVFEKRRMIFYA